MGQSEKCGSVKNDDIFNLHLESGAGPWFSIPGLHRLQQILYTILNSPNRFNIFTTKDVAMYVLDDYSVHVMPEIKKALSKRSYVSVIIGSGVTGDIKVNDTDLHAPLKAKYWDQEQSLMIDELGPNPKKVPQPKRDYMKRMLIESLKYLEIDFANDFKALWVTKCFGWKWALWWLYAISLSPHKYVYKILGLSFT